MQFRPRRLWLALSVTILVAVTARPSAETIEAILVRVNGDILTKTDLEQRQVQYMRAKNLQPADDAALKKTIEEITPEVVSEAIDEILLVQRGKALNYKMTDEDFDRVVQNIRKENKLDTEEAFQAALKQEGMSLPELHKTLERQMLIARVTQNEVMTKVGITEEEARKYHSEHLKDFTKAGTVTIREILVKVPLENGSVNVAADQTAKQKADDIRKRALAGESFDQLASEFSDSPSKANGGLIGPLNTNELTPAFKTLVDPMKVGEVSEVLRGQGGYQIIKIENRTADEVMTPEAAHDKISDALYEEKRQVYIRRYLNKLRSQATIEWRNEEIHKAFETWAAAQPALPPDPNAAPDLPTTAKPGSSKPIPKGSPTPEKEPKPSNN
jgi:peptidyl-prolyl cis-trans isomerase SurA